MTVDSPFLLCTSKFSRERNLICDKNWRQSPPNCATGLVRKHKDTLPLYCMNSTSVRHGEMMRNLDFHKCLNGAKEQSEQQTAADRRHKAAGARMILSIDGNTEASRSLYSFACVLRPYFIFLLLLQLPPCNDQSHTSTLSANLIPPVQLPLAAVYRIVCSHRLPTFLSSSIRAASPFSTPASCSLCLPFACSLSCLRALPISSQLHDCLRPHTGALSYLAFAALPSLRIHIAALYLFLFALLALILRMRPPLSSFVKLEKNHSRVAQCKSTPGNSGWLLLLYAALISSSHAQSSAPCRIFKMEPGRGPPSGGTPITIMGANFTSTFTFVSSHTFCKFSHTDELLKPTFLSATRIICMSPPSVNYGYKVFVHVTNDGGYTFSTDLLAYYYEGETVRFMLVCLTELGERGRSFGVRLQACTDSACTDSSF
jgi:hypothetical protein